MATYEHEFAVAATSFWMDSRITRLTMGSIPIFTIDHCGSPRDTVLEIRTARVKLAAIYGILPPRRGHLCDINVLEGAAAAAEVDAVLGQLLALLGSHPGSNIRMTLATRQVLPGKAEA